MGWGGISNTEIGKSLVGWLRISPSLMRFEDMGRRVREGGGRFGLAELLVGKTSTPVIIDHNLKLCIYYYRLPSLWSMPHGPPQIVLPKSATLSYSSSFIIYRIMMKIVKVITWRPEQGPP